MAFVSRKPACTYCGGKDGPVPLLCLTEVPCVHPLSLTPPRIPGHTPRITPPYDPEQARRLLAQAGFPTGRGFPPVHLFAFQAVASRNEYLQRQWAEVLGMEIRLEIVEWATFSARLGREPFHIVNLGWVADYPDPDNFLRVSRARAWSSWQDESYEALIQTADQTLDQAQRLRLYAQAEQRLVAEAPILPLVYERDHLLIKPWVTAYPMSAIKPSYWKDVVIENVAPNRLHL